MTMYTEGREGITTSYCPNSRTGEQFSIAFVVTAQVPNNFYRRTSSMSVHPHTLALPPGSHTTSARRRRTSRKLQSSSIVPMNIGLLLSAVTRDVTPLGPLLSRHLPCPSSCPSHPMLTTFLRHRRRHTVAARLFVFLDLQ